MSRRHFPLLSWGIGDELCILTDGRDLSTLFFPRPSASLGLEDLGRHEITRLLEKSNAALKNTHREGDSGRVPRGEFGRDEEGARSGGFESFRREFASGDEGGGESSREDLGRQEITRLREKGAALKTVHKEGDSGKVPRGEFGRDEEGARSGGFESGRREFAKGDEGGGGLSREDEGRGGFGREFGRNGQREYSGDLDLDRGIRNDPRRDTSGWSKFPRESDESTQTSTLAHVSSTLRMGFESTGGDVHVKSTWRALEFAFIDKQTSPRRFAVSLAEECFAGQVKDQSDMGKAALAFLIRGRTKAAGKLYGRIARSERCSARAAERYKKLSELCESFPGARDFETHSPEPKQAEWTEWNDVRDQFTYTLDVDAIQREDGDFALAIRVMQGDVKSIIEYFLAESAAWGGKSWPCLLAALLMHQAPNAQRHVLGDLATRCAESLNKLESYEACLFALRGQALQALQCLHNVDPWAEAHMGEIFTRCGAIESVSLLSAKERLGLPPGSFCIAPYDCDVRETLILNYCSQLILSPQRRNGFYCELEVSRFTTADTYLKTINHKVASRFRAMALDHAYFASEAQARRVFDALELSKEEKLGMGKVQFVKWISRAGGLERALWWACACEDETMRESALEFVLSNSPQMRFASRVVSYGDNTLAFGEHVDDVLFLAASVFSCLARAGFKLSEKDDTWFEDRDRAVVLAAQVVERIPVRHRLGLLRSVLLFALDNSEFDEPQKRLPVVSSDACLKIMRVAIGGTYEMDAGVNAVLVTMFAKSMEKSCDV